MACTVPRDGNHHVSNGILGLLRARCTESGTGEQNRNEENDGYFHVGIIITPPPAAQVVKIGLYPFVR